jgi:GntR family transcriptional repressor for pyruvate dehydrogenase complex
MGPRLVPNKPRSESRSSVSLTGKPALRGCDALVAEVKRQLFEETLRSGDFLGSESTILKKFNVGRRTAREAIQSLEALGIVEVRPGSKGGVWIAEGNPDRFAEALSVQFKLSGVSLKNIFQMQHLLETNAARLAAAHRTSENLGELKSIVQEGAALIGSQRAFKENSLAFHSAIAKSAQNPVISSIFLALRLVTRRDDLLLSQRARKNVQSTHMRLYRLIEQQAADEAARLMGEHMHVVADEYPKMTARQTTRRAKPKSVKRHR